MIIHPYHKIVLITPPRCGSTSLHSACWESCIISTGMQPTGQYGTHTIYLPDTIMMLDAPLEEWKYFIVTRNPYSRILSLYQHCQKYTTFGHRLSFQEYIDCMMYSHTFTFYTYPVFKWKFDFNQQYPNLKLNHVDINNIVSVLAEQGMQIELEFLNSGQRPLDEATEHTRETIEFTRKWAVDDFREFEYSNTPYWQVKI